MRALIAALVIFSGCATTQGDVCDHLDAQSDAEITEAVRFASSILHDRQRPLPLRMTAAKTLGWLRDDRAVDALSSVLLSGGEAQELRAFAAWGLGELRSEDAIAPLTQALFTAIDDRSGERVLEALMKHDAIVARSPERLVEIVEALVFYAGNRRHKPSPMYDLLDRKTRTLPVAIEVLDRASAKAIERRDPKARAAMYQAAYELLARVASSKREIATAPEEWRDRIQEAVSASRRVLAVEDLATALLVLSWLGELAEVPEVAGPAASTLVGDRGEVKTRPTLSKADPVRLVASWALVRMHLHSLGARRALLSDVIARETTGEILRVLADAGKAGDYDLIQKLIGAEAEPGR